MRSIFALIIVMLSLSLFAGQKETRCIKVKDIPDNLRAYDEGENLLYVIKYTWGIINTDVGEARISLSKGKFDNGTEYFHSTIYGYTYRFYDVFFRVRDLFESKFNTVNGRPYYFHRNIQEGRYRMKNYIWFNPDYSINASFERLQDPQRDTLLAGNECTFDLVSLFYFTRNIDFSQIPPGVEQPISFAIDGEINEVFYRMIGPEKKRVPGLGQCNTVKFAARAVAGKVFTGKEDLLIWVSDDKNRVPLMFETPIIVGSVTGRLKSYNNLKHPLTSIK